MNFNVKELTLAGDLIRDILSLLNSRGTIEVNLSQVDFSTSAFRALEREYLDGSEEKDNTTDGLVKKGVRFVMSAVYLDGSPVMSTDTPIETDGSFAFWDGEAGTDNAGYGKKQVVHSDLMITRIDQIKVHTQVWEYRNGKPGRRLLIDGLDGVLITVTDLATWETDVLSARDYGISSFDRGKWNVANWLETVDTTQIESKD